MHIITGFILAGLAGKLKKNQALGGLPHFKTGPLRIVHAIPGRIRFIVPSLRKSESNLRKLNKLYTLSGVSNVNASIITGSIVIKYDSNQIMPPMMFAAIAHLLELENELNQSPTPALLQEIRAIGKSFNRVVYQETYGIVDIQTITIFMLIFLGGKKFIQDRWASLPAGITLLWWALNAIQKENSGI